MNLLTVEQSILYCGLETSISGKFTLFSYFASLHPRDGIAA